MGGFTLLGLICLMGFLVYEVLKVLLIPILLVEVAVLDHQHRYSRSEAETFLERNLGKEVEVPNADLVTEHLRLPKEVHVLVGLDLRHRDFLFENGTRATFEQVIPFNED